MGTKVGIGIKQDSANAAAAAREATRNAMEGLGTEPDIVFVFSSVEYTQEDVIRGVRSIATKALIVGGSAAGEIDSHTTVFDGVVVQAISSDEMFFTVGCGTKMAEDSFKAGADVAKMVLDNAKQKLELFVMFPDGMSGDGAKVVEGVQSVLGKDFPIVGGSLGDDYRFQKTWQYYNDQVLTDSVVGVGLSGDFSFGIGSSHGWQPIGLSMKVTKTEGVVLKEIDNEPALNVYQEYFGKKYSELIKEPLALIAYAYPLAVSIEGSKDYLIRNPVVANNKGEITMSASIPEGSIIRLMIGDPSGAIEARKEAVGEAIIQLGEGTPVFALVFNSMARNKLLGLTAKGENQEIQRELGKNVPMIGFYTYGEQASFLGKKNISAYFQNETITVLIVGNKK